MKEKLMLNAAKFGVVGTAFAPFLAHAQLSTSSASTIAQNAANDLGAVLADVIPVILVIVVALLAIGMGIRYVKKHISGRKF